MAQKGLMKFLSRKDGKNTVSDNEDNEKAKLTRVLEFVQARKPEQAKLGEVVRFMYYPGDGTAAYWMQGMLAHRLDKYKVAKASNFTRNRFKVKQLKVVTCWGVRGEIPETVTVNLSRNTVWSLGTETLVLIKILSRKGLRNLTFLVRGWLTFQSLTHETPSHTVVLRI